MPASNAITESLKQKSQCLCYVPTNKLIADIKLRLHIQPPNLEWISFFLLTKLSCPSWTWCSVGVL